MVLRLRSRPSKGVWVSSEIVLGALIIYAVARYLIPLAGLASVAASLPATAQAPSPIPSRIIKAVEFEDFGHVYRVDTDSGKVTKTRVTDVQPLPPGPSPQPTPTPNPVPTPIAGKPGWVLLFFSQSRGDAQWGDSEALREAVAASGAQFRTFRSNEPEIDELGYRRLVAELAAPCIVVVDTDRKVMFARKLASLEDTIRAVKEMR